MRSGGWRTSWGVGALLAATLAGACGGGARPAHARVLARTHTAAASTTVTPPATATTPAATTPAATPPAGPPLPVARRRPLRHGRVVYRTFFSPALHRSTDIELYLPPGYAAAARRGTRFPVFYILHAPPGNPAAIFGATHTARRMDRLIAAGQVRPMIVAVPFGLTTAYHDDTEWANAAAGRYMDFVLDAVHAVDRDFHTFANRQGRALSGLSGGGYGAVNVGLHNLGTFSIVQSWSGYFDQTPTASFVGATRAELRANSPDAYVRRLAPRIRRLGLRAWLYQGLTEFIAPWRVSVFAHRLHAAGAEVHFGWFPGEHGYPLWSAQLPRMLEAASAWFGIPPAVAAAHPVLQQVGRPLPIAEWRRIVFNPRRRCAERHPPPGQRLPAFCR